jgi:flagellar M-ring protein FliF
MTFDTTAAAQAEEALAAAAEQATAERTADLIKTGGTGGGILLLIVGALVLGMRASKRARREALDLGELDVVETRRTEAIEAAAAARALTAAPMAQVGPSAGRREDIMALAAEQPAEVAEVLRGWLVGGRR